MRHSRTVIQERWGLRLPSPVTPRVRAVWLYHAGGNASALVTWLRWLPLTWEILVPEYPGRAACVTSESVGTLDVLAEHLNRVIPLTARELPLLLIGHSMGGLVAFELVQRMPASARQRIAALVVSAVRAPVCFRLDDLEVPTDQQLVDKLLSLGATPRELVDDEFSREALLGDLRVDYRLLSTYRYRDRTPLDVPLIALSGSRDRLAPPGLMEPWRRETMISFDSYELNGGHFYYLENPRVAANAFREIGELALDPLEATL